MNTKILIAGSTGMLGHQALQELLKKDIQEARLLVRSIESARDKLKDLVADERVTMVEGDLGDKNALLEATKDIDAVISMVQGDASVIIDGQYNLLLAAEENSVKAFMPSDFSVEFSTFSTEEHVWLGLRAEFRKKALNHRPKIISVQQGAFTEMILSDFLGNVDVENGEVKVFGTGDELVDFTTVSDTAKYVAELAVDPNAPEVFQVAGETTTWKKITEDISELYGKPFTFKSLGSLEEIKTFIETKKSQTDDPFEYAPKQYEWAMISGRGKLTENKGGRYPNIKPVSIKEHLQAHVEELSR